jgi:chromosome segregation ATPase
LVKQELQAANTCWQRASELTLKLTKTRETLQQAYISRRQAQRASFKLLNEATYSLKNSQDALEKEKRVEKAAATRQEIESRIVRLEKEVQDEKAKLEDLEALLTAKACRSRRTLHAPSSQLKALESELQKLSRDCAWTSDDDDRVTGANGKKTPSRSLR